MDSKVCTKCRETKPLKEFNKSLLGLLGIRADCKSCQSVLRKALYQKNSEKEKANRKQYYVENAEKEKAYRRDMYSANPQPHRDYSKNYRKENAQLISSYNKEYYERDAETQRKRVSIWRKENPEKKNNLDRVRRAKKRANQGSFTSVEWEEKKKEYNYLCVYCNKKKRLTADHIIPIDSGGSSDIENIVPACHSCNSSKQAKPLITWLLNKLVRNG